MKTTSCRGEGAAIRETHAASQMDRVGAAVLGDFPADRQRRFEFVGAAVDMNQVRCQLVRDQGVRHAAGKQAVECGRIGVDGGNQVASADAAQGRENQVLGLLLLPGLCRTGYQSCRPAGKRLAEREIALENA